MNNDFLCQSLMAKALESFSESIYFSFICGSRANGKWTDNSDIDVFILLKDGTSIKKQNEFLSFFKQFHIQNNLLHDHCGEVFEKKTLDYLIDSTFHSVKNIPQIKQSICYRSSCLLSEFRKGRVVLGMLQNSISLFYGDTVVFNQYRNIAIEFFGLEQEIENNKNGRPVLICPTQEGLEKHQVLNTAISKGDYQNTPVGVDLGKWFNRSTAKVSDSILSQCIFKKS